MVNCIIYIMVCISNATGSIYIPENFHVPHDGEHSHKKITWQAITQKKKKSAI